jgi:hypothetical protein
MHRSARVALRPTAGQRRRLFGLLVSAGDVWACVLQVNWWRRRRQAERGPADAVEDEVEVAVELFADTPDAEAAQDFMGWGGIADQRGDVRAAGVGKLDRDPPDTAGGTRDQHPLAEQQAGNLPATAARSGRR